MAFLLAESVNAADLTAELVRIEPLVFVSDPNHALTKNVGMTFRDLNGQSILLPKHDCSYKMQFEEMLTAENISPSVVMEFNSIEAIKQCVIKGLGITGLYGHIQRNHETFDTKLNYETNTDS